MYRYYCSPNKRNSSWVGRHKDFHSDVITLCHQGSDDIAVEERLGAVPVALQGQPACFADDGQGHRAVRANHFQNIQTRWGFHLLFHRGILVWESLFRSWERGITDASTKPTMWRKGGQQQIVPQPALYLHKCGTAPVSTIMAPFTYQVVATTVRKKAHFYEEVIEIETNNFREDIGRSSSQVAGCS